jgi:hypothetical protein
VGGRKRGILRVEKLRAWGGRKRGIIMVGKLGAWEKKREVF